MPSNPLKIQVPLRFRNIVLRLLLIITPISLLTGALIDAAARQFGYVIHYTSSWIRNIMFPIFILLHHTLRLWPRKYWLVVCEVLVSLVEVVITGYFFGPQLFTVIRDLELRYIFYAGLPVTVAHAAAWFAIVISSFITLVFLFCDILKESGKSVFHPYDFSAGLCPPGHQWSFICGRFVGRKRFSADNLILRCVRAAVAFFCLVMLLALVIYALILQPIESSGRQGIKIFKIPVVDGNIISAFLAAIRNPVPSDLTAFRAVLKAPNVSASNQDLTMTVTQVNDSNSESSHCQNTTNSGTVFVNCPSLRIFSAPSQKIVEILITIHFPEMTGGLIYLGLINSTNDITAGAETIGISPGSSLYALSTFSVKESISNQKAAAFGIPQYRRFGVMNIHASYPDLLPSLPRDNHTATLRIQMHSQPYITIEQEYTETSVLNGFALVGGVWTLINGVFAAIFGSTLLLILFGMKPLSIYGLVHLFRPGRRSLADGGYTLSSEERDRIVGILREHLLDLEGAEEDGASSSRLNSSSALL